MTDLTLEQRNKRLLSPESANLHTTNILDKRQRHDSISIIEDMDPVPEPAQGNKEGESDLKTWMIENLATKIDFTTMSDRITAQGEEIKQLRDELTNYKKEFDNLRLAFDRCEAQKLSTTYENPTGNASARNVNNMAAPNRNGATRQSTTRRNIEIEGLRGESEDEMIANLLRITTGIGSIVYKSDIEDIFRMERRDNTNKAPGPVMVTLTRISLRDGILKKKLNLRYIDGMKDVYINADETVEVRRSKAILRKAARNARLNGEEVELRHDRMKLGDVVYTTEDLHKIPTKYMPDVRRPERGEQASNDPQTATPLDEMETSTRRDRIVTAKRRMNTTNDAKKTILIKPGEKMRVTQAGLCFSGSSAFPSNMYYATVTFNKKEYNSNEQAYQCTKADCHDKSDMALALKQMTNSYEIKIEAGNIQVTDDWNKISPDILWDLFDKKMMEHPELLERSIETAPLRLIEASKSMKWGGGAPFESKVYDTDEFPGENRFGDMATRYRDQKIREREQLLKEVV